jgi:hypothetical protein
MPRRPERTEEVILPIRLKLEATALRYLKATKQKHTHVSRNAGLSKNYLGSATSRKEKETAPLDTWLLLLLAAGCTVVITVAGKDGFIESVRCEPLENSADNTRRNHE